VSARSRELTLLTPATSGAREGLSALPDLLPSPIENAKKPHALFCRARHRPPAYDARPGETAVRDDGRGGAGRCDPRGKTRAAKRQLDRGRQALLLHRS